MVKVKCRSCGKEVEKTQSKVVMRETTVGVNKVHKGIYCLRCFFEKMFKGQKRCATKE